MSSYRAPWCAWERSNPQPLGSTSRALCRLSYRRLIVVRLSGLEPEFTGSTVLLLGHPLALAPSARGWSRTTDLSHTASGAEALYRLSYARLVRWDRVERSTPGLKGRCSSTELPPRSDHRRSGSDDKHRRITSRRLVGAQPRAIRAPHHGASGSSIRTKEIPALESLRASPSSSVSEETARTTALVPVGRFPGLLSPAACTI